MSTKESTLAKINQEADSNRRNLVRKLQEHLENTTKTPYRVLSYIARFDIPAGNILPQDGILFREALKQLENPPNLALIIHSPGGVIEATEKIGLLLRGNVNQLIVIIPDAAKSAATMLTLLANQIHMSDLSELGPIDPQIVVGPDPNTGMPVFRPAWSILNAPFHLQDMWKKGGLDPNIVTVLARHFDPTLVDVAQNALDLATTIAESWLTKYMGIPPADAKKTAEDLTDASKFLSHGRPIRLPDAQKLKLNAIRMDPVTEDLTFELYLRSIRVLRERRVKIVDWDSGGLAADI
jgi:hypothetical protein